MDEIVMNLTDVISVYQVDRYPSPLNLQFRRNVDRLRPLDERILAGAGVYMFGYGCEIIYIGKYQPIENCKIFEDRWLRHFETLSLRGARVGFGGRGNAEGRLNKLLTRVYDDRLRSCLQVIYANEAETRFRDTGVLTSNNKVAFAGEKWAAFEKANESSILKDFTVRLLRIPTGYPAEVAARIVSHIEKGLITEFKACCNGNYRPDKHYENRKGNIADRIEEKARALCRSLTQKDMTHQILLA